ncbi:expressed unknown protein [Seminavis robusta]|uniref:Uncharacterized protein n=1 Tax=Seminavis robusta TaxID=568900 RepID=A0A9N8H1T8_9STRA|nr:expressed unknown protein [Seminavis robusta]|eukprot:Sro7_g006320.1 n/a (229) ;mRNA; f:233921-234607
MELLANTTDKHNLELHAALGYERHDEKLTPSQAFVKDASTQRNLKEHGMKVDSKQGPVSHKEGTDKLEIHFPVNAARPPVGDGARIVRGPRMVRRCSTGYVRRSKARRQSGAAVNEILEMQDFQKFENSLLDRKDSLRLIRGVSHMLEDSAKELEEAVQDDAEDAAPEQDSDMVMRIYRRKPRRMSGCAVSGTTMEGIKTNMPCLLQRENSIDLSQKRMRSRRASMTF